MGNSYCRKCVKKLDINSKVNYCYNCINKCERCNGELNEDEQKKYIGSGQVCIRCYQFYHSMLMYPPILDN